MQLRLTKANNRFGRSRSRTFGEPWRESMIAINQLRYVSAQPRVAQLIVGRYLMPCGLHQ